MARVETTLELQRVRREARTQVETVAAQLETLVNQAPLGIYLIDADFRILQVNPTARSVFGDVPDLLGRDFDEVIHILWPRECADEVVRRFRHTLETGEPYVTPEHVEQRLDRGATEYYEWRIHRIVLPDGRFGVVCYFRDIEAQVKAREAISISEARFRQLAEIGPQFIWVSSGDGVLEYINQRWTDYSGLDSASTSNAEQLACAFHDEDRARVSQAWRNSLSTGQAFGAGGAPAG